MSAEEQQSAGNNESKEGKAVQKRQGLEHYYSVVSRPAADGRMMIGQDIEIFPGQECPDFASPGTRAYEAKDRRLASSLFVLICSRSTVPRVTAIGAYKNLKNPNILPLIEAGVVYWGPENRQRFSLVFEKPPGKKILDSPAAKPYRISEDKIVSTLIEPAVEALVTFRNADLVHGAINAENIYFAGAEGAERVILGECLSSAPSWRQHALYETIPRGTAQPSGRGTGTIKDDLYALGICAAMIARGDNILAGKSPQQILYEKIEHGSYGAVVGRERLPSGISDFLRGVLNDDETQRWDIDDVQAWLEGRRLAPKPSKVILRAARPLILRDQKHWDLRSVALAFAENIEDAAAEIEKDQFELWLKRNFEDKSLKSRLDHVKDKEKTTSRDRLVFNVCMAIDPFGPIRYKGHALFPWGLGMALAEAVAKGEDIQIYGEIISQQLFNNWISQIFEDIPDAAGLMALFEKCRTAFTQKMPGYGIERVLYWLNPEAACMSPVLKDHFVLGPGALLLALEDIARRPDRPENVLDRHMVSFVSVREPKMIDPYLGHVSSSNKGNQVVGIIRTLAAIQRRFAIGPVPGVCSWLISLTAPVLELLKDRDLRHEVSIRIGRLQDGGNLTALLNLVDDSLLVQRDAQRFVLARQEFRMLAVEKNEIEGNLRKRQHLGKATGRQIAMLLSSILAAVALVSYIVLRLTKGI